MFPYNEFFVIVGLFSMYFIFTGAKNIVRYTIEGSVI